MFDLNLWNALGIIAIICLVASFFIGKNAIWGGLTLGIVISVVALIVNLIIGNGFKSTLYKDILTVSVLAGALFEFIGRLSKPKH